MRTRVLVVAATLLAVLWPAGAADAHVAVAVLGNRYVTPAVVVVDPSRPVTFVNADLAMHDVVAFEATRSDGSAPWCFGLDPGTCPLFWSELIGPGTTEVLGLTEAEPLVPYAFFCSIHPFMRGILVLTGDGG